MRTKEGQDRHDHGVLVVASEARQRGWTTVFADLPTYAKPPVIQSYVPDIYAHNGRAELIVEVETNDSIGTAHAIAQKMAFTRWQQESPTLRKFQVIVA